MKYTYRYNVNELIRNEIICEVGIIARYYVSQSVVKGPRLDNQLIYEYIIIYKIRFYKYDFVLTSTLSPN